MSEPVVLTENEIYERMVETILDHRLPPGTKLVEDRLATAFGVSRTRIRPVLVRLANEQIVTLIPNRGATVAEPSVPELKRLTQAMNTLEDAIRKIDAETREIERSFRFAKGEHPLNLCINPTRDTLYFLNRHVWKMATGEKRIPEQPFIESQYTSSYKVLSSTIFVFKSSNNLKSFDFGFFFVDVAIANRFKFSIT